MLSRIALPLAWAAVALLTACGQPKTGPIEVHWDRDGCERCRMVLSDRHHAAQVRGGAKGEPRRVYEFDDLGCALLWLEDKPWKDDPNTELWVNDHRDGHWIDARKAWYLVGEHTPMAYGLGAREQPADGAIDFSAALRHVQQVEARYNAPGTHLQQQAH